MQIAYVECVLTTKHRIVIAFTPLPSAVVSWRISRGLQYHRVKAANLGSGNLEIGLK